MATPIYEDVLSQINTYIVTNGNNEITADVLNPILELILNFSNNNIGDLSALTTDETNSIVEAINSLKLAFDNLNNTGVQLHTGYDDPNITPPSSYNYGDFFMELDIADDSPVKLWQWNGFEWLDYSEVPATESDNVGNNSEVSGSSVTDALNNLLSITGLPEQLDFEANGIDNFIDIGTVKKVKSFYYSSVLQIKDDWSQTGSIITFTFTPDAGAGIKNLSFI